MKKLLFAGLVFFALSACSHDIVTETKLGKPIAFQASVATKGTEITTGTLERFYAKAFTISDNSNIGVLFEETEFARMGDWFYSNPAYYWPENEQLLFILWAPSAEEMGMTIVEGADIVDAEKAIIFRNVAPKKTISEQLDYLGSLAIGNNQGFAAFAEFRHVFSQIEVKAKNTDQNTTYKVTGVRLANLYGKVDIPLSGGPIIDEDSKTIYEDVFEDTPVTVQYYASSIMKPDGGNAFLIPQLIGQWDPDNEPSNTANGAYISVRLQAIQNGQVVFPKTGEGYGWVAIPMWTGKEEYDNWQDGYKYIYTLDFSTGIGYPDPNEPGAENIMNNGVSFSTGIGNWNDKSDSEATNELIIGHWVGQKAHRYIVSKDNETEEYTYDTPERVRDFLNTFYDFVITDDTTIKIKDANGNYSIESSFFLKDNYFYLDAVKDPYNGEYQFLPYIEDIGEDYVVIKIVYEWDDGRETQTIYFTKSKLTE